MRTIFLDLEMNPLSYEFQQERSITQTETIEFGAVMLDEEGTEIASFKEYVRPAYSQRIQKHIEKLTGITWEMVEDADEYIPVMKRFLDWCGKGDCKVWSWSMSDLIQLQNENHLKQVPEDERFRRMASGWGDVQAMFCGLFPMDHVMSLEKALTFGGVDFQGRAHDALTDARAAADLYRILQDPSRFQVFKKRVLDYFQPKRFTLGDMFNLSALKLAE